MQFELNSQQFLNLDILYCKVINFHKGIQLQRTIFIVEMTNKKQNMLLDIICDMQEQPDIVKPKGYNSAFIVHFILKVVPLGLLGFDEITNLFFQERVTGQLIIMFIVFQFWFTKNVTGKRMLGYKWGFEQDEYGEERLTFECRANSQFTDVAKPKLFWIVQFVYCVISLLFIVEAIFLIPNAVRIDWRKIQLNLCLLTSGVTNIFFFLKIADSCGQRQRVLRTRLGMDGVRKLGLGSIVSHY